MTDRRGLALLIRASARQERPDRLTGENIGKKRAARGCKRPKSREETPKEGGGNATTIAIPRYSTMPPRRTKGKSRFWAVLRWAPGDAKWPQPAARRPRDPGFSARSPRRRPQARPTRVLMHFAPIQVADRFGLR